MIGARRPWVYAVSSRKRLAPAARTSAGEVVALYAWLVTVIEAGVDAVQIRERDLPPRVLRDVVRHAMQAAAGRATAVLVSDRADVAAAGGAGGVHLPSDGLPVSAVRRLRPDWLVGRSVHEGDTPADDGSPDYVLFGTVFASRSKQPSARTVGLDGLRAAVQRWPCPVVAIGGISVLSARACVEQGASGVAAIGLFLPPGSEPESLGPAEAVRQLRSSMAGA